MHDEASHCSQVSNHIGSFLQGMALERVYLGYSFLHTGYRYLRFNYLPEGGTEKSAAKDYHFSSLCKPCDVKR